MPPAGGHTAHPHLARHLEIPIQRGPFTALDPTEIGVQPDAIALILAFLNVQFATARRMP